MENQLRTTLLATAGAYSSAEGCGITTVSRRTKNDAAFFGRIADPEKSFTARTFDEVMGWFASNWPAGKQMPLELMLWMSETGYQQKAEIPA
jgi:hypothetical protein